MNNNPISKWQVTAIGALTGLAPLAFTLILMVINIGFEPVTELIFFALVGLSVMPFGILGAFVGYWIRKSRAVIIVASILGTVIGSLLAMAYLIGLLPQ